MDKTEAPDWVHVFVCVNDRDGERPSCADGHAVELHSRLKALVKERGWSGRMVRVSKSGCLGLCQHGPNVLFYPQGTHYSHVSLDDMGALAVEIENAVAGRVKDTPLT